MNYFVSFLTALKVSRYLFRVLVFVLWLISILLSAFYITTALRSEESSVRLTFNLNYDQALRYIQHTNDRLKELKYITENQLSGNVLPSQSLRPQRPANQANSRLNTSALVPLIPYAKCDALAKNWRTTLHSVVTSLHNWSNNFFTTYDINHLFLIDINQLCMVDFGQQDTTGRYDQMIKTLRDQAIKYRNNPQNQRINGQFWVYRDMRPGIGYLYAITPIWLAGYPSAMLGIEQIIHSENMLTPDTRPVGITILDNLGHELLTFNSQLPQEPPNPRWLQSNSWFGYSKGFKYVMLKKNLPPSNLSIVYSLPVSTVLAPVKTLILNSILFNLLLAAVLFILARQFEKRLFTPAERDAQRLEEHEQFNRKIVAYAPVGICILRIPDGTNILSNELAYNYLNMLTHEDKQHLTQLLRSQRVNLVDMLTSSNTHLQISLVHSRYRNENVAICVLVDVSERVKMEKSLQEVAQTAEQANQAKSMFLATVSHELRTPLYGIIGNLDLLRNKPLANSAKQLVVTMSNSSNLLLKIISDILDFSKIESEQLKIESLEFSPREVISHITANYLPLLVRKQLTLYCFIDPQVPGSLHGDAMRLQQVISNLLNNAIKFTDFGCIILQVSCEGDYLMFQVRDTGVGIPAKELPCLFDPFFQIANGMQHDVQGTGLGLAICEKLISMMDGDIAVKTMPGMGSQFTVRIPLYHARKANTMDLSALPCQCCWLAVRNPALYHYLQQLLACHKLNVCHLTTSSANSMPADATTINYHDLLITDSQDNPPWSGQAVILFCRDHIGMPVRQVDGVWLISTASPHDIIPLLHHIYPDNGQTADTINPALSLASTNPHNGDILILVVDDHPVNRQLLSDQLALLGYQCITAHDGVAALDILEKTAIDIVLTDVNMPNMGGYALTRHIRENQLTLPVIGVTANALAEEKQRCLDSGMNDCLSKPVTLTLLQRILADYTNKLRNLAERS